VGPLPRGVIALVSLREREQGCIGETTAKGSWPWVSSWSDLNAVLFLKHQKQWSPLSDQKLQSTSANDEWYGQTVQTVWGDGGQTITHYVAFAFNKVRWKQSKSCYCRLKWACNRCTL